MTTVPMAPPAAGGAGSGEKGLKGGALGLVASIVVGMATLIAVFIYWGWDTAACRSPSTSR